jgi:hypothetical protein
MGLNASKIPSAGTGNTNPQEPMEAGTYPCRIVQVLDLGLQAQRPYQGQEKPPAQMIMVTYEFTDEFMKDEDGKDMEDKPRWLSEEFPLYNLNQDKAKSTKRYLALDADKVHEGDWTQLVGQACNVTVVNNVGKGAHEGKTFTNIASVASMRSKDADRTAPLVNDPKTFNLEDPSIEIFNSLPDWLQEKIKGNLNFKGSALDNRLSGAPETEPSDTAEEPQKNPAW